MKTRLRALLASIGLVTASFTPVTLTAAEKSAESAAIPRHPLRGVITTVAADQSAFMVKHEDIPGVMRAMTMMFKVDAATLKAFKVGDAITGQMSRQGSNWVLENVKPAAPAAAGK